MCDSVVSEDPFMPVYWPNKYKTQKMCDEASDGCLVALTFIPDWFVTSKMLAKFDDALRTNDDILFFNEDFDKVTYIANQRHILAVNHEKLNLTMIIILMKTILLLLFM